TQAMFDDSIAPRWFHPTDRHRRTKDMTYRTIVTIAALATSLAVTPMAGAQMPGGVQGPGAGKGAVPSIPSKSDLLSQAKQMVSDLTSMKSSGKLTADQAGKVDAMLPKANALSTELEKPQIETTRLGQLAKDLGDLQKQLSALKSLVK